VRATPIPVAQRSRKSAHSGLCDAKSGPLRPTSHDALSPPFIRAARRRRDASGATRVVVAHPDRGNKTAEKKRFRPSAVAHRAAPSRGASRALHDAGRVARSATAPRAGIFFASGC